MTIRAEVVLILGVSCVPAWATGPGVPNATQEVDVLDQMQTTREGIAADEHRQREALSHLFLINKRVKEIAQKQDQLNQRQVNLEANVRNSAQEVAHQELQLDQHKAQLNRRLRQLYQERGLGDFHWLFSAQSPVEIERNHRFLRRMIDSDHRQLHDYITHLNELSRKRNSLKELVAHLGLVQREVRAQEAALTQQLRDKSLIVEEIRRSKEFKLSALKGLRVDHSELNDLMTYAFFERKGQLRAPVNGDVAQEYGTIKDPQFHFRLAHKGLFYRTPHPTATHAVAGGRVVFARALPGYGSTVILDHGDNYYSVYADLSQIQTHEGQEVRDGEVIALSGAASPLFGPGLYFEIRHFTDAIDPRIWIKDSVIKTAAQSD